MHAGQTVGFIGLGVMGASMAGHLLAGGYRLIVHTRTKAKAQPLLARGMTWRDTPGDVAAEADAVITMVGYPSDVESVYLGSQGIVQRARPGTLLIDMTTSSPALARRIAAQAMARGLSTLDAPVSGGDVGAREAKLSIMVGGEPAAFDRAMPLFQLMGRNIVHQGDAGTGQHAKMCNQIAIAAGMIGVCEAMLYAKKSGLNPQTVLQSISAGAAGSWSLSNLAPRILQGDFSPGFYVKHFIKDMGIALDSAAEMGLDLPGLKLAHQLYDRLAASGGENLGTQGLFTLYARQLELHPNPTQTPAG
ncbi:MAG: NAD(P)-dependent oxidoreductase [Phycisphaeraceae bacterium]|nr:NAD(P)-dependent oxidoreductase [Phycisphaeraceae bacterium]